MNGGRHHFSSIIYKSHTFPQLSFSLFALHLQPINRILQSLFLLLQPFHLQHLRVAQCRRRSGFRAPRRLCTTTETRVPSTVRIQPPFQKFRSCFEALLFPCELVNVSFSRGDQLVYCWYYLVNQGLLGLSESWFGQEFKMLLGLEDFAEAGEVGHTLVQD